MRTLLLLLLALPSSAAWHETLPAALEEAKAKKASVLVDFEAPWCYSCYYMRQKVLDKPRFAEAASALVLAKLDVDKEEGHALKAARAVTFLPTYLVLDAAGKELGRIVGEQTEDDFLAALDAIRAARKEPSSEAKLAKLRAKAWKGDISAYSKLLDEPVSCALAYDVLKVQSTLAKAPAKVRQPLVGKARGRLDELGRVKLFVPEAQRCADLRSGVEALIAVDEPAKQGVLERTLTLLNFPKDPPGEDRNRDDNVRYFLELKDDEPALERWYRKLSQAYPEDYVYPYRWAKRLESRERPQDALPWIEQADKLAYGANRLQVTLVRAKVLAALGRNQEAMKLAQRDLKAAAGKFPSLEKPLGEWLAAARVQK